MLDKERLKFALENYKKDFPTWWEEEKYKWEAVKCFQDNWDINASDFEGMLSRSLAKTGNLLAASGSFPMTVIKKFSKVSPEETRLMFAELFNENDDLYERIKKFKSISNVMLEKYGNGDQYHFQNENSISTYLWLKYPKKYYIYKFREVKKVADYLRSNYVFKQGAYKENIERFYTLYNEVCVILKKNIDLIKIFQSRLTDSCYADSELKTLTIDFCFYISRHYNELSANTNSLFSVVADNLSSNNLDSYTKENFLSEVFISEKKYNTLAAILDRKKNIILQGAPGVGKTFAAKRLAYSIIGEKNDSQIEFVQFHQNYSYEDFIMGWRPTENNFELRTGIFYNFCKKAEQNPNEKFFFIIDEINRGNMSKIFGELLMLIEADKRGKKKIKLAYNDENFSVPENLFIIGMMNTADRSLAIIDYALRRRFSFFEMNPAFDSDGFKKYQADLNDATFDKLINKIKILNEKISADNSLGNGFCIGHSYFCNLETADKENLRSIVEYEILPMLEEYFFDDSATLQDWKNILRGVFND